MKHTAAIITTSPTPVAKAAPHGRVRARAHAALCQHRLVLKGSTALHLPTGGAADLPADAHSQDGAGDHDAKI